MSIDPEHLLVGGLVFATLLLWLGLCWASWRSAAWSRRSSGNRKGVRLALAIIPLLVALLCLTAEIRFTSENNGFSVDASWLFLVHAGLGTWALIEWFKARSRGKPAEIG